VSHLIQSVAPPSESRLDDLRDVQEILAMLALALAVIAAPATQPLVAKVLATVAQHTAMAWAELLEGMIESNGGDL
jgi:DNA-binding GntR family transcriptional regulator